MHFSRRDVLKHAGCGCLTLPLFDICRPRSAAADHESRMPVEDRLHVLAPGAVRLEGYLESYIERSINAWNKGVLPYKALVDFFRTGRPKVVIGKDSLELFASGEMWGKAVRSSAMLYRYTGDPELKTLLRATVADLLATKRENGSISCSPVEKQPDGPAGDIWERSYVLLGLDDYYQWVEQDPHVLQAMIDEADATLAQVGPPPKTRIVELGWSPTRVESSAILAPMLRLYRRTGDVRYLTFARYIVETEGGAKGHNLIDEVLRGLDPVEVGGIYPKVYETLLYFAGVAEYHRATGNDRWGRACLELYRQVRDNEITLTGNSGGDEPYHPNVRGEAWDNTAFEQTNPNIRRMMETCAGVTWLEFCSHVLRLTGDPIVMDYVELYAYNGLIGAQKPAGDGFSYVNLLNGVKTDREGWGATIANVYITCCNLNGPLGLAYLPYLAVMSDQEGLVVNLYNAGEAHWRAPAGEIRLIIQTRYPLDGRIRIHVRPSAPQRFTVKLRIPAWSQMTTLKVNRSPFEARPGSYARVERRWMEGDLIELDLDMRCRLIRAKQGLTEGSDRYQALVRGPVVLARDENIDPHFSEPVAIVAQNGLVEIKSTQTSRPGTNMQFEVPTSTGPIPMVDYASVDSWQGKRVQTWLPLPQSTG